MATDHNFKVKNGLVVEGGEIFVQGTTTPQIYFNGSADSGIDMAIKATPESLDFYEPEDNNKLHMRIVDDAGVNAVFGVRTGVNDGTLRIDGSGNLTNIGTISSGAITSSGNIVNDVGNTGDDSFIELKNTGYTGNVTSLRQNADSTRAELNSSQRSIFVQAGLSSSNSAEFRVYTNAVQALKLDASQNATFASNITTTTTIQGGAYKLGSTVIVNSNRDLTNIGTISSGAITATGTTTLSGLTVDGAAAVKYANSSAFGNQTFSYAAQGFDAFQIYNDNSTSSTSADQFVSLHMRADGAGNASARMVLRNDNSGNGRLYFMLRSGAHTGVTQPKMLITDDGQVTISTNATTYNERLFVDGNLRVEGVYKSGTQTIIDANRNLSNIGTISSGNITSSGDVTISGNLTVNGTQTTLNTATLQVEDKNIILNYGSGDTSGSANGAGITIQDAMAVNHDATILWDTSNDRFNFSDPVNVDITGPNNTPSADALTVAGYGIIGNRSANVYITNSNSSGGVQIGVGGAHNANPKLTISSSAATFTVPVTSTALTISSSDAQLKFNAEAYKIKGGGYYGDIRIVAPRFRVYEDNESSTAKFQIDGGNATFAGSVTGTYFLASGADTTPAGTTFANAFNGSTRVAYFDGDTTVSTWYGSGNTPYAAIDATNGVLKLYVNDTSGNWHQKIGMTSSGVTHYGTVTSTGVSNKIDSGSYATFEADGNTNEWKWLRLSTNGTTAWDIAARNNDLSNALQFRPGGGATNRTSMSTAGDWTFGGRITVGDTTETQKIVLNFDTGGNMILGSDGSYGTSGNGRYITLGFGGRTNGSNRIFAHNGTNDGIYFAAATGQGFRWRPNGSGTNEMELSSSGLLTLGGGEVRIGQDSSYGNYATIGFGGTGNGSNRVFAHKSGSDGLFLASATGRHIYFRTNGSSNETFRMSATGDFQMGSANTTVIDSSRNLTNIGTMSNTGKHSSSIGSNATYSRPLLEITTSATPTQIKITTNILYSGTGASTHAHSVTIRGFQYGNAQMADLQIGWHVYNNEFYNRSVTSSGSWAPTVTLAVENNKVVIHLASPGYWPKLYVESMYNAYGGAGQASGWSWADAAISADSGTPNQTVPYKLDFGDGVFRSAGTTVIDSNSFRGREYIRHENSNNIVIDLDQNTYTIIKNPLGETRLWLGSSGYSGASSDTNNYYNGSTHFFRDTGSNESARISGLGVDAKSGGFLINGTSVINSSRNIHNVGTISSGNITSTGLTVDYTGNRTGDAGVLVTNDENDWGIKIDKDGTDSYGLLVQADGTHAIMVRNASGAQKVLISGTGNADFEGSVNATNTYELNGTTVINSSGQFVGGLNPSSLDITHSSADSVLRIAHGAANSLDAVIQLSGSASNIATEGAEIWYDNSVGDVHIATTYVHDDAYIRFHTRTGASKSTSNERLTIAGNGTVGINKSSGLDSSYKLDMGGHIKMNNKHIHYINEAHFNAGTRFLGSSGSNTILRSANSTTSNWLAFQSGSSNNTRGYVGGNADSGHSVGLLDSGGSWAVRHINDQGTIFYSDNGTEQALIGSDLVSGDYGGMVLKSAKNGWAGYSINNRAVFMHDNSNTAGIYNDVENEWFIKFQRNGSSYIYTNGHGTLQTLTSGIQVNSSSGESTSQIKMYTNGTIRGYFYANTSNNIGILDAGGEWALRHIENQGTELRQNNTVHASIGQSLVGGTYGSMVVHDTKNGWGGYSINSRVVFMHDHANTAGLYNDVNNHWLVKTQNGGTTELYFNGSKKLETTTSGIVVTGNVAHDGLTMTSGTDIDQLYTVTDSLTLTTSYQDTSINSSELATGTYIMQLYIAGDHSVGGSHYTEFYSGVISWYGASTNSTEVDEIVLHRAGHAPNSSVIHLRTQRHASGGDNLVLQIKGNYTMTAARNYVFKFRRMI